MKLFPQYVTPFLLGGSLAQVVTMHRPNHDSNTILSETETLLQNYQNEYQLTLSETQKATFLKNLEIIQNHNADSTKTWTMGINKFTHLG